MGNSRDSESPTEVGVEVLIPATSDAGHPPPGFALGAWRVDILRMLPSLVVLAVLLAIWQRSGDAIAANHWAYPAVLAISGALALISLVRARPRRWRAQA